MLSSGSMSRPRRLSTTDSPVDRLPGAQTTGEHVRDATSGRPLARCGVINVGLRYGRIVKGDRAENGRWPQSRQARRAGGVLAVRQAER